MQQRNWPTAALAASPKGAALFIMLSIMLFLFIYFLKKYLRLAYGIDGILLRFNSNAAGSHQFNALKMPVNMRNNFHFKSGFVGPFAHVWR